MVYSCSEEFDVIIIGAGIMGSSTAYQLSKRGQKTLLLEQFDLLHHRGSSHGESRTFRATYPEHYYHTMVTESSQLWEQAESEIGYRVYFKTQHFDMGPTDDLTLKSVISSCQKNMMPHQILNHHQVSDKFSGKIFLSENWTGISTELGGVIKPTKAVSMFQTLSSRNGAVLKDNTEVETILPDKVKGNGVVVCTTNGEKFYGKKCVVTTGAWSKKLVKTVNGMDLPIQPLETNVCYWRIKEGYEFDYSINGGFPTFASYGETYLYGTPSFEFPGLIKIGVHGGYSCNPDMRPWGPKVKPDVMKEWIKKTFNGFVDSSEPVSTQSCMYSMTPDEDFVIDFLGGEFGKDVVIGGGFSGHGFKMGPVVGRILADLVIDGEAKGVDLKHFEIGRFEENPKGNLKDYEDQVWKSKSKSKMNAKL